MNGKQELGFCCDNCRKSYHKYGGAYRKLKPVMVQMVEKKFAELERRFRQIVREEIRDTALTAAIDPHEENSHTSNPAKTRAAG